MSCFLRMVAGTATHSPLGRKPQICTNVLRRPFSVKGRRPGPPTRFCFAPIVLKMSFWGDERKFLEPLMRFARGDMRDHIVSHKNYHGASYRRYGVFSWRSRLKINFCEIFGVVRFSTFATLSPQEQKRSFLSTRL